MGTVAKVNNVLCDLISKIDDVSKVNASKFDDNNFCVVSPTPTPTPTTSPGGTVTPTPTPTITPTITPTPTPTPTPTITPTITTTPTPTPTPEPPCAPGCCYIELCAGADCVDACSCNSLRAVYLSRPCKDDPCELNFATGIYEDSSCTVPASPAFYSDGTNCYEWDGSSTLTYQGPC